MTWYDFVEPLVYAARPCVMLPAVAYAMEFLWTSIMTTVEIPQLFPELFGFNTQQTGKHHLLPLRSPLCHILERSRMQHLGARSR